MKCPVGCPRKEKSKRKKSIKTQIKEALKKEGKITFKENSKLKFSETTPFRKLTKYFWWEVFKEKNCEYEKKYHIDRLIVSGWWECDMVDMVVVDIELRNYEGFKNIEARIEKWRNVHKIPREYKQQDQLIEFKVSMPRVSYGY